MQNLINLNQLDKTPIKIQNAGQPRISNRRSEVVTVTADKQRQPVLYKIHKAILTVYPYKKQIQYQKSAAQTLSVQVKNKQIEQSIQQLNVKKSQIQLKIEMIVNYLSLKDRANNINLDSEAALKRTIQLKHELILKVIQHKKKILEAKKNQDQQYCESQKFMFDMVTKKQLIQKSIMYRKNCRQATKKKYQQEVNDLSFKHSSLIKKSELIQNLQRNIEKQTFKLQPIQDNYLLNLFHIQVLKLQLRPAVRIGFSASKEGLPVDQGLKDRLLWDSLKNRKIEKTDILFFILIQLYKDWRRILRKLSYQSQQYKVLLGVSSDIDVAQRIKQQFLTAKQLRPSSKKVRRIIAIGSPIYDLYQITKDYIVKSLQTFGNGVIRITNLEVREHQAIENCQELIISYQLGYDQQNVLVQTYQLHRITQFNKENISKYLGKNEKISCIVVQIPLYNSRIDNSIFQELYDFLKKEK